MANDDNSNLFTQKASDKLRSPDDLDEYVRVTNPSVWVVLAACAILMIGVFAWGFLGTAETSVSVSGTRVKDEVVCFLSADAVAHVSEGDAANVDGRQMEVTSISTIPVSRIEARGIVGSDYLASTIVEDDWTYVVTLDASGDTDLVEGIPLAVTVTTERIPPATLLFGEAT